MTKTKSSHSHQFYHIIKAYFETLIIVYRYHYHFSWVFNKIQFCSRALIILPATTRATELPVV